MKRATCRYEAAKKLKLISIHALVKRATLSQVTSRAEQFISIHALVKRATFFASLPSIDFTFQSTPS